MKKIITISGDPVSGKGTIVKLLKKEYEEKGYNVYVISVGNIFREVALDMYKKDHPEIENPTIEQVNNDEKFAERRAEIDLNIDSYIAQKGKEVIKNATSKDVYIFDSRLAFSNIPESFAVRLTVDEKVAGERVFSDTSRGEEDQYETIEQAIESTKKRKAGEIKRYKERYGVDLTDENNYNIVINTSYAAPEDITRVIESCLTLEEEKKPYSKNWASPKWFLPLQNIRETWGTAGLGLDIEGFVDLIKREGYRPDCPIDVIQVDGYYYIIEGHHRNFAAGINGMTLVPYEVLARDDEIIEGYNHTATDRVKTLLKGDNRRDFLSRVVYDHEDMLNSKDENGNKIQFYYTQVYGSYPRSIPEKENDKEER